MPMHCTNISLRSYWLGATMTQPPLHLIMAPDNFEAAQAQRSQRNVPHQAGSIRAGEPVPLLYYSLRTDSSTSSRISR